MIARIWRGAVRLHDGDAYAQYMRSSGMPGYESTPGNVAALMLRRDLVDKCEFLMISLWESMDSIRAFAGDEPEQAVFYPEDDSLLIERDVTVRHYVVDTPRRRQPFWALSPGSEHNRVKVAPTKGAHRLTATFWHRLSSTEFE